LKKIGEYSVIFIFGAAIYSILELIYRAKTHWSMTLTGGLCFAIVYCISKTKLIFPLKCIISAIGITVLEFLCGCLVNIKMKWNVWDYSNMPFNCMGQICLSFYLLWLLLSAVGLLLSKQLRSFFK